MSHQARHPRTESINAAEGLVELLLTSSSSSDGPSSIKFSENTNPPQPEPTQCWDLDDNNTSDSANSFTLPSDDSINGTNHLTLSSIRIPDAPSNGTQGGEDDSKMNPLSPRRHTAIAALGGLMSGGFNMAGSEQMLLDMSARLNGGSDHDSYGAYEHESSSSSSFPTSSSSMASSSAYQTPQPSKLYNKDRKHGSGPVHKPAVVAGGENVGRWTKAEHGRFLEGLELYGKEWKQIASLVNSRSVVQTRTHAQKYFQKLLKQAHSTNGDTRRGGMSSSKSGVKTVYGTSTAKSSKGKKRGSSTKNGANSGGGSGSGSGGGGAKKKRRKKGASGSKGQVAFPGEESEQHPHLRLALSGTANEPRGKNDGMMVIALNAKTVSNSGNARKKLSGMDPPGLSLGLSKRGGGMQQSSPPLSPWPTSVGKLPQTSYTPHHYTYAEQPQILQEFALSKQIGVRASFDRSVPKMNGNESLSSLFSDTVPEIGGGGGGGGGGSSSSSGFLCFSVQ